MSNPVDTFIWKKKYTTLNVRFQGGILFYIKNGFKTVGRFHNCSYKFNRWYDMIWMEKIIGDYTFAQPPIIPYPEVNFSEDFSLGIWIFTIKFNRICSI